MAFRMLGFNNPYQFLRDFKTEATDENLRLAIEQAQNVIKDRLIESRPMKTWQDYVLELHSEEFWKQLKEDVVAAPEGITTFQFLYYFDRENPELFDKRRSGTYINLYSVIKLHTEGITAGDFIRTFTPTLFEDSNLSETIQEVQQMITEKFVLGKTKGRSILYVPDFLADSDYWERLAIEKEQELPIRSHIPFSARVARFIEALQSAGLETVSTSIIAHHLAGRYHTGTEQAIQFELDNMSGKAGRPGSKDRPSTLEEIKYLLNIDQRVISALQEQHEEFDEILGKFVDGVITRAIREELYLQFFEVPIDEISPEAIERNLGNVRKNLRSMISFEKHDYLDEKLSSVYYELAEALERTQHLREFFTHPLSLEQVRVINALASSEGHDFLGHLPGEGKTAMALAGVWEYFRRNNVENGVVLYFGPVGAVDNLQRNFPDKLNQKIDNQFQIIDWTKENSVSGKYQRLLDAVRDVDGPIILPLSYSMIDPEFIADFNLLVNTLQHSHRQFIPIADEIHHSLGYKTVYTKTGVHENSVIPISGLSSEKTVVAVEKPPSFLPIDFLLRATPKNVLISGTPLNTGLSQLLHLASIMESRPEDNNIVYPSFEQVKGWVDDPLVLSSVFQEHMHRSSHLRLPNIQRVVLECNFEELPEEMRKNFEKALSQKVAHQLWQLSVEFQSVFPFVLPMLNKSQDSPVVISVPYIDEKKVTGSASTKGIADYLRSIGFYGTSRLDSTLTNLSINEVINQFKEDDGTDIIVISPALGESRDLHSAKRPTSLVISLGATTLRGYEQAIRRVVRTGNPAETVYVVTPIPKNLPTKYSLLERRHDVLQERLETSTAILDPVNFIKPERSAAAGGLEEFLPEDLGVNTPPEREYFTESEEPFNTIAQSEEIDYWNKNSLIPYVNSLKEEIASLKEYRRPVSLKASEGDDTQNQLMERGKIIHNTQERVIRFVNTETTFILQELETLSPGNPITPDLVQEHVTSAFLRFCGVTKKDEFMYKKVLQPALQLTKGHLLPTDFNFESTEISDRTLIFALRQKADPDLRQLAWEKLHERYGGENGFIKANFRGYPQEVVEDLEQEIWLQLVSSGFTPYRTLHAIIKRIGEQRIGPVISGSSSVKSLNFADVEGETGRPIEESGRLHPLLEDL